jgi:hypothetical protein
VAEAKVSVTAGGGAFDKIIGFFLVVTGMFCILALLMAMLPNIIMAIRQCHYPCPTPTQVPQQAPETKPRSMKIQDPYVSVPAWLNKNKNGRVEPAVVVRDEFYIRPTGKPVTVITKDGKEVVIEPGSKESPALPVTVIRNQAGPITLS